MASASTAASRALSSSQRSPVRRLVKAEAKPVARATSCSSSVIRAARHQGLDHAGEGPRLGRRGGPHWGDVQAALAQLHPLQLTALQPAREAPQAPVEFGAPRPPAIRRRSPAGRVPPRRPAPRWRQQVAVEATVAGGALDPDVARAQPVAQRRQHCRLVEPPVRALRPAVTRRRHALRNGIGASGGTSRLPVRFRSAQQLQGGQHGVVGAGGTELQRLDQGGGELPQRPPAVGGAQQRVLLGEVRQLRHLAAHPQQLRPADGLVHHLEGIAVALLRSGERVDGAVEQPHQPTDVAGAGGIAAAGGVACPGEQAADQPVSHVQHRVGQAGLEVEDGRGEDGAAPAGRVAASWWASAA